MLQMSIRVQSRASLFIVACLHLLLFSKQLKEKLHSRPVHLYAVERLKKAIKNTIENALTMFAAAHKIFTTNHL